MKVFLSTKADRQLKKLPEAMYNLLLSEIKSLSQTPFPHGVKKLINRAGWRIKLGDYRILYTVDKKRREVIILSASHRREAYKY